MTDSMMLQDYSDIVDGADYETFATYGTLTKTQGVALLSRLVGDSSYKMRFEHAPARALAEIGVPAEQIATLRVACLSPRILASAETLQATLQRLKDDIDRSADVNFIYLPVDRHADMLLLSMKQHGERGGTRSGVGRTQFPRRNAVVCAMLREEGGEIMVDERAEIDSTCSRLERAEDGRKDTCELDEELLVVTRDPCPPWVYVGTKGECYEVVELRVERWIRRGGLEERGCGRRRCEVREKEAIC